MASARCTAAKEARAARAAARRFGPDPGLRTGLRFRAARAASAATAARHAAATSARRRCCCSRRSRATATRSCRRSSSAPSGVWRPSPGSVYPALAQLEDEGLIRSEESDGRKRFAITDAGREQLAARPEGAPAPWDTLADGVSRDVQELFGLMRQVGDRGPAARADRKREATRGGEAGADRDTTRDLPDPRQRRRGHGRVSERGPAGGGVALATPAAAGFDRRVRPHQALRRDRGGARDRLRGRAGRDLRLPRPQRRRQVDDDLHALHARHADRRDGDASPASTSTASATPCGATSASSSRTRRSTATSPPSRTCACTPSSTASRASWSHRGCSRCSRWSGCGSAARAPSPRSPAA